MAEAMIAGVGGGLGNEQQVTPDNQYEELFPGILNEISLDVIVPMLSWRECNTLSAVSLAWRNAMKGHQILKARVRTRSAEPFALVQHLNFTAFGVCLGKMKISLYSLRDGSWYELPPIPGLRSGFPESFECTSLDGKIYLSGSSHHPLKTYFYMLDLVGRRLWRRLKAMPERRDTSRDTLCRGSSSGVIDGKIYVFVNNVFTGGSGIECEVYNPDKDVWSNIKPMKVPRPIKSVSNLQVGIVGEEFLIYSETKFDVDQNGLAPRDQSLLKSYHPIRDEWRSIEAFESHTFGAVFTAQGKLYAITELGIYVHVIDDQHCNSRTLLPSSPFTDFVPPDTQRIRPLAALHTDGEVLLLLRWENQAYVGMVLLRSRGFSQKDTAILWETIRWPGFDGAALGFSNPLFWRCTGLKCSILL